jgi:hypothetical protein
MVMLEEYDRRSSRPTPPCSPLDDVVDEDDEHFDNDLEVADMLEALGSPTLETDVEIAEM